VGVWHSFASVSLCSKRKMASDINTKVSKGTVDMIAYYSSYLHITSSLELLDKFCKLGNILSVDGHIDAAAGARV